MPKVTKATSLAGPECLGGEKNLICDVCHEVYRSPRILQCFHTFCLCCLEKLISLPDGRYREFFPCPSCRRRTAVPPDGALGFQMNFYITEKELEVQKKGSCASSVCPNHEAKKEPLAYFCFQCNQAICIRCVLTTHNHQLDPTKHRLEKTIDFLTKKSKEAYEHLGAAKKKGHLMKKEIQENCDILVARAYKCRDIILSETEKFNNMTEQGLTKDAREIQHKLDALVQHKQRIRHTLDEAGTDAEKGNLEKEIRDWVVSADKLMKEARASVPNTTKRPGLHYGLKSVSDSDIRCSFGFPQTKILPWETSVTDVIHPFFRCGKSGEFREVHNVYHSSQYERTVYVSYGEHTPSKTADEKFVRISNKSGTLVEKVLVLNEAKNMLAFKKHPILPRSIYKFIISTSFGFIQAIQTTHRVVDVHKFQGIITSYGKTSHKLVKSYEVQCGQAVAFDTSRSGLCHAFVVEEKTTNQSETVKRCVSLYTVDNEKMVQFSSYTPSCASFYPTDVCFWRENGLQKILVADAKNDCVHVVRIEKGSCHFERFLAAGDAHLIQPTALGVDKDDVVWIGCSNGWILRCETTQPHDDEMETTADTACSNTATSQISPLMVENVSVSTGVSSMIQSVYNEMETAGDMACTNAATSLINPLLVENASVSTGENASVSTVENAGVSTDENAGVSTDENAGVSTDENAGVSTDENAVVSTVENAGVSTVENSSVSTDENASVFTWPSFSGMIQSRAEEMETAGGMACINAATSQISSLGVENASFSIDALRNNAAGEDTQVSRFQRLNSTLNPRNRCPRRDRRPRLHPYRA